MKTQKELLAEVLTELADLKQMVMRINQYVSEIQASEAQRRQNEIDALTEPVTLMVNEYKDCWEFDATSIRLERQDRLLINDAVHFCLRGEDLTENGDTFKRWIIWEFNASNKAPISVYGIVIDEDGTEELPERLYLYRGKFRAEMFKDDDAISDEY